MSGNKSIIKDEIEKYLSRNEDWLSKISSAINMPFEYVFENVVPEVISNKMQSAFKDALGMINDAAQYAYSSDSIFEEFKIHNMEVHSLEDVKTAPFEICDKIAQSYIQSNKLIAAIEGGGAGLGGLALMAADIPILMTINFRMISQIAGCFGYDAKLEIEKAFILNIFTLAAVDQEAKFTVWAQLNKISAAIIRKKTWDKLEEFVIVKLIQEVAERLGINLTKRKLGQLIPIIGAGVGAGMNYSFTLDNGIAALMSYRQRRLTEETNSNT